jgi:glucose-1-phosphate thymidylyltransferase
MLAKCDEVVIVVNEWDFDNYQRLIIQAGLSSISMKLAVQEHANGIVGAIKAAVSSNNCDDIMVVLGDNVIFGSTLGHKLLHEANSLRSSQKSKVYTVPSSTPERFGVVKYDNNNVACDIIEKPIEFVSNDVIPGIYFYKSEHLIELDGIKESGRGELEITDLNRQLLKTNRLDIEHLGRGIMWLDCGNFNDLLDAGVAINLVQKHSNEKIGNIFEIDKNNVQS